MKHAPKKLLRLFFFRVVRLSNKSEITMVQTPKFWQEMSKKQRKETIVNVTLVAVVILFTFGTVPAQDLFTPAIISPVLFSHFLALPIIDHILYAFKAVDHILSDPGDPTSSEICHHHSPPHCPTGGSPWTSSSPQDPPPALMIRISYP